MSLADMVPPTTGTYKEKELQFFDGSRRKVFWTDQEVPYPEGRLIVSRTDTNGMITHANDSFVEMSGYEREELIGAPHNILRHPEMPAAAFKSLWADAQAGQKWHGYVKNLCKDGSYYWVYATVVPNIRNGIVVGYTSVRRKPSRTQIAEILPLYEKWLNEERNQQGSGGANSVLQSGSGALK